MWRRSNGTVPKFSGITHEAVPDLSALMKRSGAEMRDAVKAAAKEARVGFTEAANTALEENVSKVRFKLEMRRRRNV